MNKKLTKLTAWSRIASRLTLNPDKLNATLADFQFLSDRETIQYLKDTGKGIVRYGDGELNFVAGYPAVHQTQTRSLRKILTNILADYTEPQTYLLAVPLDLLLTKNYAERNSSAEHWRAPRYAALPYLKKNAVYGSPFCFRLTDVIDSDYASYKKRVLSLFDGFDVIYVGSKQNAVNHISPAVSISIPPHNSYSNYRNLKQEIEQTAAKQTRPLVAISGGVTATALAAELNTKGILTYDIGSLFSHASKQHI